MTKLTGGQAVIAALMAAGVDVVFGIVGVHNMHIYDALYDHPTMRQVTARHEQGVAFMADGYARASGRVGVTLPITGPGGTNAATGIAQAYADSSRILVIQSDVESGWLGREAGTLHEMPDQHAFFKTITGRSQSLSRVEEIPEAITAAFEELLTGRPRPIHLNIPHDLLAATANFSQMPKAPRPPKRQKAEADLVQETITLLRVSQRPVIYAGGGVISAEAAPELLQLAELLQAPVVTTTHGRGAFPDDHHLALGNAWSRNSPYDDLAREADLVLAVGTQLSETNTRAGQLPLPQNLIHIDVEAKAFSRFYTPALALHGDAKAVLIQLLTALKGFQAPDRKAFLAGVDAWRTQQKSRVETVAPQAARYLTSLRQALARNAILVNDMTMPSYWAQRCFPVYEPRTFQFPFYFGTLGFSYPAAIGAKLAHPERQVVSLCGDGSFLFSCQDMATAVQLNLDLPVVVFNDNCFNGVKSAQDRELGGRHIGIELRNPDFVRLGNSFGARSRRVENVANLGEALTEAFAIGGPWLIEVPVRLSSPRILAQGI